MKKKLIYILFPVFICIITVVLLNSFLDKQINTMLKSKDLKEINVQYGSIYKDRGVLYNEYVTENNYLVLQGSSELASPVPQLPTTLFPVKGLETIVTNGRAYSQDLNQISILGSQNIDNKERKVAMVLSLQWFENEGGIDNTGFQANFSPAQFYAFLSNKDITDEHKKEYAYRVDSLLTGSSEYASEKIYAKLYTSNGLKYKIAKFLFKPYFWARENMVKLKDKGLLYRELITLPPKKDIQTEEINWNEEYKKAEEDGKSQVTNNDFYVYDTYYNLHLKDYVKAEKDSNKGIDLMKSKEFKDYELYLDTCVDLGVKPYIILMPTNGRWYDYTGMTKESRDSFYDKVEEMAKQRGFEVLNLKDEEYTPYFMCDVMHLGWKGWLKVDEELYKHYKDQ